MLIVQSFHSIHEIDPEFIPNIETLLKEEIPDFKALQEKHDTAPASDVFTYFLFFGPTQNTPVGFAQVALRKIPYEKYVPWWKRFFFFWRKDYLHWKEAIWKVCDGSAGMQVFDSKYARSGKEKLQEIIEEYETRAEVMAQHIFCLKGLQEYQPKAPETLKESKEAYILEPFSRSSKSYQDYLGTLAPEIKKQIKENWKTLHKSGEIQLGDYQSIHELSKSLPLPPEVLEGIKSSKTQIITFEKSDSILGCVLVTKGKLGNFFFEPFPFEPENGALISDDLYIQHALIKFFDMPEARRAHIIKNKEKLIFADRQDLNFFTDQGFGARTMVTSFYSRLKGLDHPL